jgi:hypothetical protein
LSSAIGSKTGTRLHYPLQEELRIHKHGITGISAPSLAADEKGTTHVTHPNTIDINKKSEKIFFKTASPEI